MDERRVDELALERRLAPVEHDRDARRDVEEGRVRRGENAAVKRQEAARQAEPAVALAAVRVVHDPHLPLAFGRQRQENADVRPGEQLLACGEELPDAEVAAGVFTRREVGAVRTVDRREQGIAPQRDDELRGHGVRAEAPAVLRLMAAEARTAVRAERREEGVFRRQRRPPPAESSRRGPSDRAAIRIEVFRRVSTPDRETWTAARGAPATMLNRPTRPCPPQRCAGRSRSPPRPARTKSKNHIPHPRRPFRHAQIAHHNPLRQRDRAAAACSYLTRDRRRRRRAARRRRRR